MTEILVDKGVLSGSDVLWPTCGHAIQATIPDGKYLLVDPEAPSITVTIERDEWGKDISYPLRGLPAGWYIFVGEEPK